MTARLGAFARFLWEFVIGDDWRIAAGVAVAIALTALLSDTSLSAWWLLPLAVALLLTMSVWDAARRSGGRSDRPSAPPHSDVR